MPKTSISRAGETAKPTSVSVRTVVNSSSAENEISHGGCNFTAVPSINTRARLCSGDIAPGGFWLASVIEIPTCALLNIPGRGYVCRGCSAVTAIYDRPFLMQSNSPVAAVFADESQRRGVVKIGRKNRGAVSASREPRRDSGVAGEKVEICRKNRGK